MDRQAKFVLTGMSLLSLAIVALPQVALAVDASPAGCSARGGAVDCDFVVLLDRQEVNTLSSPATRALIAAKVTALAPPATAVLAIYIDQRIQQVQNHAGPNGARVQITLRNGQNLHLFDVFPR